MDDRELLELAARAAGISGGWGEKLDYHNGVVDLTDYWVLDGEDLFFWNPLADDGDALRLAVKLSLIPGYMRHSDMHMTIYEGDAKLAETRRAIVRAAAEIGRSIQDAPQGRAG